MYGFAPSPTREIRMLISVTRETWQGECRVALVPKTVRKLKNAGFDVTLESGAGERAGFPDASYQEVGATIAASRESLLGSVDIVLRVRKPSVEEVPLLYSAIEHISFLDPFNERELVRM